jgi:hypothetical protein
MRCAYLTTDEVNNALAQDWADLCGVELRLVAPKDGRPTWDYDAVLCDWDFWPVESRREMLLDLNSGLLACPLFVHSYNLDEEMTMFLRDQGVDVQGALQLDVFRKLRRMHRRAHARRRRLFDSDVA